MMASRVASTSTRAGNPRQLENHHEFLRRLLRRHSIPPLAPILAGISVAGAFPLRPRPLEPPAARFEAAAREAVEAAEARRPPAGVLVVEPPRGSKCCGEEAAAARAPEDSESSGRVIQCVVKPLACAVFFIAVGFAPFHRVRAPAAAAVVATELNLEKLDKGSEVKGHEYSNCTKRLLEKVSVVLRCMDEIRRGEGSVKGLEVAMKAVKLEKRQLQGR
ncbi:hypothetical protein NL676_020473 [Syzygium grande]|nr:hypothetical protein NL676_020473 [Syzygium grande]